MKEYIRHNRDAWNKKVSVHYTSDFYANDNFMAGESSLKEIELSLLGDIKEKKVLHLQCHFGQDTISLSRKGATVTGVDFSEEAIKLARNLARELTVSTKFICSDVYELPNVLDEKFDIVFTTYGTIGWLPDIDRWAKLVSSYLKPGGNLVFAEFHPVVWMFDDNFKKITYAYFKQEPIVETEVGTYADRQAGIEQKTITWNHSLSEVMQSLIDQGLSIDIFREYDYSPYNCFNGTIEYQPGKFRIASLADKIPMVYAIKARQVRT